MKVTLNYEDGKVKVSGIDPDYLTARSHRYIERLKKVYGGIMKELDRNNFKPEGKLEMELTTISPIILQWSTPREKVQEE